jgi:hypothetical protein
VFLRSLTLPSSIASALVLVVLGGSPSHAVTTASVGVAGSWSSATAEVANPPSAVLSFSNLFAVSPGDGFLTGYNPVSIDDLPLVRTTVLENSASSVRAIYAIDTAIFDGLAWKTYEDASGNEIVFNLDTDATWLRFFDKADTDTSWEQWDNASGMLEYTGTYILPGGQQIAGTGVLNASSGGNARVFETTQSATVIPLPATAWLLLGAAGLMGFVGRRKGAAALPAAA